MGDLSTQAQRTMQSSDLVMSQEEEEQEVDERVKKKHWSDRLIIRENSKWKASFDMLINLLVGYSCFTTIY